MLRTQGAYWWIDRSEYRSSSRLVYRAPLSACSCISSARPGSRERRTASLPARHTGSASSTQV
ncbi:hypothetical protein SBADM41S_05207 [Streptomyces badius]